MPPSHTSSPYHHTYSTFNILHTTCRLYIYVCKGWVDLSYFLCFSEYWVLLKCKRHFTFYNFHVKVGFAWFYHYYGFLKSLQVFVGSAYLSLTKKTFFKNEVVFLCEIARNRYGIWVLVWNLALPILSPLFLREGFAGELESWQFRSMKFTKIFLFKS